MFLEIIVTFFLVLGVIQLAIVFFEVATDCFIPNDTTYILLPFKNNQDTIEHKINKIATLKKISPVIIAVDTGSDDGTNEILQTLSRKYECLKITDKDKLGEITAEILK